MKLLAQAQASRTLPAIGRMQPFGRLKPLVCSKATTMAASVRSKPLPVQKRLL
ncbi:hypothetical protein D3C87_1992380 [compost metagenome]